jgi:hypothetical protein
LAIYCRPERQQQTTLKSTTFDVVPHGAREGAGDRIAGHFAVVQP